MSMAQPKADQANRMRRLLQRPQSCQRHGSLLAGSSHKPCYCCLHYPCQLRALLGLAAVLRVDCSLFLPSCGDPASRQLFRRYGPAAPKYMFSSGPMLLPASHGGELTVRGSAEVLQAPVHSVQPMRNARDSVSLERHRVLITGLRRQGKLPAAPPDLPIPAQPSPLRALLLGSRLPLATERKHAAMGQHGIIDVPIACVADLPLSASAWLRPPSGGLNGRSRARMCDAGCRAGHSLLLSWPGKGIGLGLMGYSWAVLLSALTAVGLCPWVVAIMGLRALIVQVVLTCTLTSLVAGVLLTCACLHLHGLWWRAGVVSLGA